MKHLRKRLLLLVAFVLAATILPASNLPHETDKRRKGKTELLATGAEDRALWVELLWKISYPVVHNLAEGTLRKNMPIENPYNKPENYKDVTHLEAVGRTLCGLAPWLTLPNDNTHEGRLRQKMRKEVLHGLQNAVDPDSPDCLNFKRHNQPIVDAAFLAHAFLRAPKALWEPLDELTKQRYIAAFTSLRNRCGAYNNWLLFNGLNEAFLDRHGEGGDPFRMTMAKNKMQEWYVGDGWYSDGAKFSMDYYNAFVIHPMMVTLLETMAERRRASNAEAEQALKRMVRYAEFSERIISHDGTFPAFGRSITYRSATFQALADVALREKLPAHIQPAQVRCALTEVHRRLYEGNQNFDKDGWLILGFNGSQPEVADSYTSTGSLYLATTSFLPLGLPADNAFWATPAKEWTARRAWKGEKLRLDYKVQY